MSIRKIEKSEIDFSKIYGNQQSAMAQNGNTVKAKEEYWGDTDDLYFDEETGMVSEGGVGLGFINKNDLIKDIEPKVDPGHAPDHTQLHNSGHESDNATAPSVQPGDPSTYYNGSYREDSERKVADNGYVSYEEEGEGSSIAPIMSSENVDDGEIKDIKIEEPEVTETPQTTEPDSSTISEIEMSDIVPDVPEETQPEVQPQPEPQANVTPTDRVGRVDVPESVPQTGIIENYTNYDYFYGKWTRGSAQRNLSEVWNAAGRTNDKGIATLNGRYLVAVAPVFGTVGDNIDVELENGTVIPCTIADAKGNDRFNRGSSDVAYWGHTYNNKADIIEWESMGNQSVIQADEWAGQKVKSITNQGSIL